MKCKTVEQWILLSESRERGDAAPTPDSRPSRHQRRINAHLAQCPACRMFQNEYRQLGEWAGVHLTSGEPSDTVLANIRREARLQTDDPAPRPVWQAIWMHPAYGVASLATLCVILVGGWFLKPDSDQLGRKAQLGIILNLLYEDTTADNDANTSLPIESPETTTLDELAEQLLILQGWDDAYSETETTTPAGVNQATDPLTHNSGASRSERYG